MESPFSKVTREISTFRKLYIGFFQKLTDLEISKNFLSTGFAGFQLTKFLTEVLKISKNIRENVCNGVSFW